MKCPMCDGSGTRPYSVTERHADGSEEIVTKYGKCTWCNGTGQVSESWARFVEIERARLDGIKG
jgi:DnaJ-class molecular chaperone